MTAVDFSAFVQRLAQVSGEAILPFFRTALASEDKSRGGMFDPVTEADRAGEVAMRRLIGATFPRHGIIGEEYGTERSDAEYVWVLDPIDGTKAFICGLPTWGTLIGLTHNGHPAYGMMNQPFTGECFYGDGASAFWRGPLYVKGGRRERDTGVMTTRPLHVRACAGLEEAILMATAPDMFTGAHKDAFGRVSASVRLTRFGADCYAYCMLAAGFVDLVIEAGLKPHDVAALIPIVTGAGGVMSAWDGGSAAQGGAVIAAGDKRTHAKAMALLAANGHDA